jgi:hypothetical protein
MKRKAYTTDDARKLLAGIGVEPDVRLVKELTADAALFESVRANQKFAKGAITTPAVREKPTSPADFWTWLIPGEPI